MKKTFSFTTANKKPERQIEAIKSEIKKYFARERRKQLPEGFDLWSFDCKFGETAESSSAIKESEIKPMIDQFFKNKQDSFYVEILARAANKPQRK